MNFGGLHFDIHFIPEVHMRDLLGTLRRFLKSVSLKHKFFSVAEVIKGAEMPLALLFFNGAR